MGYESHIKEFKGKLSEKEIKFLEAAGQIVKSAAKLLCPVGAFYGGSLRQDINHQVNEDDKSVAIGNNKEYAIYVLKGTGMYAEDGNGRTTPWKYYDPKTGKYYWTHGQKPQNYLEKAINQQQGTIKKLAEDILGEVDDG
jgi:HK97 gp10 family phage protein